MKCSTLMCDIVTDTVNIQYIMRKAVVLGTELNGSDANPLKAR